MNDIHKIYSNTIGITFYWKKNTSTEKTKIQLVFKDIGFLVTLEELQEFLEHCNITFQSQCCHQCTNRDCRSLLLKTISSNIDLAVSQNELEEIKDLIQQTIIKTAIQDWVENLCLN